MFRSGPSGGLNGKTNATSSDTPVSRSAERIAIGTWSARDPNSTTGTVCSIESTSSEVDGLAGGSSTSKMVEVLARIAGANAVELPDATSMSTDVVVPSGAVNGKRPVSVIFRTLSIPVKDPNVPPVAALLSVSKNPLNSDLTGVVG